MVGCKLKYKMQNKVNKITRKKKSVKNRWMDQSNKNQLMPNIQKNKKKMALKMFKRKNKFET